MTTQTTQTTPARSRSSEAVTRPVHEVGDRPVLTPAVDIFESKQEYLLRVDLPGVDEQDIDIGLERGELVVFAKREVPREGLALERRPGDLRRAFKIPDEIDAVGVEAKLSDGVLTVHLPKSERIKPRKIAIKAVS